MKSLLTKIFPDFGLQSRLTLLFILLSSVPLILMALYTVNQQLEYKREQNIQQMQSDVKGLKESTSLFLTKVESEISLVMKSAEIKRFLTQKEMSQSDLEDAAKGFLNIIGSNSFYTKIDLLNKKGKEILSVVNFGDKPGIINQENLSKFSKNFYVQAVNQLSAGEINLSPSEINIPGTEDFLPVIDFILPVYGDNNRLNAIVTVKINAEKLFELLVPSHGSADKKIFIVNGEGFYIFNSERKNNWNSLFTSRNDENLFKDYSDEIARKILSGESRTTLYHNDRLIQFSPIFSGSKAVTDRYFIIEDVDANLVLASMDGLKRILTIIIIIASIISLLAGYLTAKKFLKPIKQLVSGTKIIREGNLDYHFDIRSSNEVNELVDNFNGLVSEWKQKQLLEKKIHESEKLFSTLTQTATDAIIETDEHGNIIVWNSAASDIFGYSAEEAIGSNILNLVVPPRMKNLVQRNLIGIVDNESRLLNINPVETTAVRKDKTEFPVELSISVVNLDQSRYITCIARDITQRKQMIEEIIIAKEKAEVADNLKTEFLNQMSHEIRTPLNIILNIPEYIESELTEKNLLTEELAQNLHDIRESGERIVRTVELIINISEIQTGTYKNNPSVVNLHDDILRKLFMKYRQKAKIKNLKFEISLRTQELMINVDRFSIEKSIEQVLDNAIKFTEEGFIRIIVEKETDDLSLIVKDTGIGISKDYLPVLFEPFTQENHGLSRLYDGNGLGLSLTKKLCGMNNVDIHVNSEKNKGTSFYFLFHQNSIIDMPDRDPAYV